jgi:CTP synthase
LPIKNKPNWGQWQQLVQVIECAERVLKIAIVGKYLHSGDYAIADSYVSIQQALMHACAHRTIGIDIVWLNAEQFESSSYTDEKLAQFDGIIIPGGFGTTGVDGKLAVITYARTNGIPLLGLCYGMQLMVVEWARALCGMKGAHTTEIDVHTVYPVIDILATQKQLLEDKKYGGTMRLGSYRAQLTKGTIVYSLYQQEEVAERHRHRYEVNPVYVDRLEQSGIVFSGHYVRDVGTQAHPEFKSRLCKPSPLFTGFVRACEQRKKSKLL